MIRALPAGRGHLRSQQQVAWGTAIVDESMSDILAAAQRCSERPGERDYYSRIALDWAGLASYDYRLAVICRRGVPAPGDPIRWDRYTLRETRAMADPRRPRRWAEAWPTPEDEAAGRVAVRVSEYVSLRTIRHYKPDPARPLPRLWLAVAGWKYTLQGFGRQWGALVREMHGDQVEHDATIDGDITTVWTGSAQCRTGRYGVLVVLGVSRDLPMVRGPIFGAIRPCPWRHVLRAS